jgi:signal peptidase I
MNEGNETEGLMARETKEKKKSKFREYTEIVVTAVVLALIVRALLIQSYHIPSESMENTLLKGDFLFANKFLYGAKVPFVDWRLPKVRDPRPGDVVIFKFPGDGKTDYIKRCIAIEGQTVEIRGKRVFVDGKELQEDYAKYIGGSRPRRNFEPFVVPKNHIFVMGDNRDNSYDSRFWGALHKKYIRGQALFLYFSVDYKKHWIRFKRIGDIIR